MRQFLFPYTLVSNQMESIFNFHALNGRKCYFIFVFMCISLTTRGISSYFRLVLAIRVFSSDICLTHSLLLLLDVPLKKNQFIIDTKLYIIHIWT